MAKRDKDLVDVLRTSGLRKKVARSLADAAGNARSGKPPSLITDTAQRLRNAASALESHTGDSSRSDAAKKAARTRKRNAQKRSAAAKKGAKTRAKSS